MSYMFYSLIFIFLFVVYICVQILTWFGKSVPLYQGYLGLHNILNSYAEEYVEVGSFFQWNYPHRRKTGK